ncbi:hypothetical protein Stsp02_64130 [Streptomyces sp. NBRC 14336]|uniref:hypothetical protein n=1 Tax=Streptomyces sp. NBRC 14336 TaxID=3030992 RepID=UPI0024A1870A|nr:hypothetical protein [Streptomyces sp. NBRC 14336]WBO81115.1 hypothetical protein SBE_004944 [Streptomyces sp. SBE_14.2]GLW50752.1 hypothetical protein Stsp02_64130 [Streptomyces sp. NBRC 14336]
MSNYHINNVNGPANFGDHGRIEINNGADAATLLRLADQLVERLRVENPALVPHAQVIRGELADAGQDGRSADRGRIRSALETIGIGVAAGSGGLALAQDIGRLLGL